MKRTTTCATVSLVLILVCSLSWAASPDPRSKEGKRLLSALDTLRIDTVASPRLSPDGRSIAYTAAETRMEKEKEWKTVTHLWVVPTAGGSARQFTRGDRSATVPEWSPDGKY